MQEYDFLHPEILKPVPRKEKLISILGDCVEKILILL
jgi:hypothetical protein